MKSSFIRQVCVHTSLPNKSQTYSVEATNAELRHYLARLARRSRCFSRSLQALWRSVKLFGLAWNRRQLFKLAFPTTIAHVRDFIYPCLLPLLALLGLDPAIPKILVSHQPPINTLNDLVWTDMHTGSESVRSFIEQIQPLLCFTGHIHEGQGIDNIGKTKVVNPGPLWQGNYAYVEINDGTITTIEIRSTAK